jgi:hypothetical protein
MAEATQEILFQALFLPPDIPRLTQKEIVTYSGNPMGGLAPILDFLARTDRSGKGCEVFASRGGANVAAWNPGDASLHRTKVLKPYEVRSSQTSPRQKQDLELRKPRKERLL